MATTTIETRPIGRSGIEIPALVLGGNVFGWTADTASSFAVLDAFVDHGGRMIDTADVYSSWVKGHRGGESETMIGRWLANDPAKRGKAVIATKVGYLDGKMVDGEFVANLDPAVVERACDASLARLGIETIDLYYQHRDDPNVPLADSLGAFDRLRRAGKIRAVGLSNFTAERALEAIAVSADNGFAPIAAFQNVYNLVDRDTYEGDLQRVAVDHGIAQLPYYGLANGFLTGKYRSRSDLSKSVRGERSRALLDSDRGQRTLSALDRVANETGASVAAVALAWLKAQPGVVAPIASATSLAQLEQLAQVLTLDLNGTQLALLTDADA